MNFLCRNPNDVKAHAELLKVDMQLVVPVDIYPLDIVIPGVQGSGTAMVKAYIYR